MQETRQKSLDLLTDTLTTLKEWKDFLEKVNHGPAEWADRNYAQAKGNYLQYNREFIKKAEDILESISKIDQQQLTEQNIQGLIELLEQILGISSRTSSPISDDYGYNEFHERLDSISTFINDIRIGAAKESVMNFLGFGKKASSEPIAIVQNPAPGTSDITTSDINSDVNLKKLRTEAEKQVNQDVAHAVLQTMVGIGFIMAGLVVGFVLTPVIGPGAWALGGVIGVVGAGLAIDGLRDNRDHDRLESSNKSDGPVNYRAVLESPTVEKRQPSVIPSMASEVQADSSEVPADNRKESEKNLNP